MATHPDGPLVVNVVRLGRRPGTLMALRQTVPSPTRIGMDMVAIQPGAAVELDLQLQSVSEGVLVTGTVTAPVSGECARCLTPFTDRVEVQLTELFAYPDSATDATTTDDELGRVVADTVDLEQSITDAVGLGLPLAPLCRDDCPGLCRHCGIPLATAEPGHHHEVIDPRWAKLTGLLRDEQ